MSNIERFLLFSLVRGISPEVAVEVGTFRGGSALIIATALKMVGHGKLWCVEPFPQLQIDWNEISDVATLVVEPSPQAYETIAKSIPSPIQFAFIDGRHEFDAVVADIVGITPHLDDNAWLLCHDAISRPVAKAIDRALQEVPELSDGGIISRFVEADQWPGAALGGLRLLYYKRQTRLSWMPPSYDNPREDAQPEQLPDAEIDEYRQAIKTLIDDGKSPIGLYGITPRLGAITAMLSEFSDYPFVILDDDPLMSGHNLLGWAVATPDEASQLGVKGAVVCKSPDHETQRSIALLRGEGITVATTSVETRAIEMRDLNSIEADNPPTWLFQTARFQYLRYGGRRFAVMGNWADTIESMGRVVCAKPYSDVLCFIGDPSERPKLWGLPVVSWDKVIDFRIDTLIVLAREDKAVAESELAARGLDKVRVVLAEQYIATKKK